MAAMELTFEAWLEHAFGHEVRFQRPPWYFDADACHGELEPQVAIDFLTRLFNAPTVLIERFSHDQIAQGLTYLLDTSAAGDRGWFSNRDIPVVARKSCIAAIFHLFAELFRPHCAPELGHKMIECDSTALNTVTYMFWDVFPCVALLDDPHRAELQMETLTVMERILALESIACVESALHGLGHAHATHPGQVEQIIDRYLAGGTCVQADISAYAQAARRGCIL